MWERDSYIRRALLHPKSTLVPWQHPKRMTKPMEIWKFLFSFFIIFLFIAFLLSFSIGLIVICIAEAFPLLSSGFTSAFPVLLFLLLVLRKSETRRPLHKQSFSRILIAFVKCMRLHIWLSLTICIITLLLVFYSLWSAKKLETWRLYFQNIERICHKANILVKTTDLSGCSYYGKYI